MSEELESPVGAPRNGHMASSGPSTLIKDHFAGGASRLAALLLPQILPVFSVVAPCQPGAALRDLVLVLRGRATRGPRAEGYDRGAVPQDPHQAVRGTAIRQRCGDDATRPRRDHSRREGRRRVRELPGALADP